MSLFEWLGERNNPGPVGTVDQEPPLPTTRSSWVVYTLGVVGLLLSAGGAYGASLGNNRAVTFALLALYLVLSYSMRAQPDYSNIGWFGGMMDRPIRWSDDVNRNLAALRLVLGPGRFAVASVRDAIQRVRGKRYIVLPRYDDE
ncbi:MAG: hypothetical protein ABJC26_11655 [Gemmatimonadaceae bacterium]